MASKKEREIIKNKFGGKCAYCGEDLPGRGWHVKHLNERNTQYKMAKKYGLVKENIAPIVFHFEKYQGNPGDNE